MGDGASSESVREARLRTSPPQGPPDPKEFPGVTGVGGWAGPPSFVRRPDPVRPGLSSFPALPLAFCRSSWGRGRGGAAGGPTVGSVGPTLRRGRGGDPQPVVHFSRPQAPRRRPARERTGGGRAGRGAGEGRRPGGGGRGRRAVGGERARGEGDPGVASSPRARGSAIPVARDLPVGGADLSGAARGGSVEDGARPARGEGARTQGSRVPARRSGSGRPQGPLRGRAVTELLPPRRRAGERVSVVVAVEEASLEEVVVVVEADAGPQGGVGRAEGVAPALALTAARPPPPPESTWGRARRRHEEPYLGRV